VTVRPRVKLERGYLGEGMKRALKRLSILVVAGFSGSVALSLSLGVSLALYVFVANQIDPGRYSAQDIANQYGGLLSMSFISLPIGLMFFMPGTVLFGPPLWWLLNRNGLGRRRYFILIGAIASGASATILLTSFTPFSLAAAIGGAVAGWIIWTLDRSLKA